MKTLKIKQDGRGYWYSPDNEILFKHFSNGSIAIIPQFVDEFVEIANMHGYEVEIL